MTVHVTGEKGIALYIDEVELLAIGFSELEEEHARMLSSDALTRLGVPLNSVQEIEAYRMQDGGAMIFAHINPSLALESAYVMFDSFDEMADATATLQELPSLSTLYYLNNTYILKLSGSGMSFNRCVLQLCEYGEALKSRALLDAHLNEHAQILIEDSALCKLTAGKFAVIS